MRFLLDLMCSERGVLFVVVLGENEAGFQEGLFEFRGNNIRFKNIKYRECRKTRFHTYVKYGGF